MTIDEVMTRPVWTCAPTDSLRRAAQIMWEHDCGSVPVVSDDGRVQGMITDRDVCMTGFLRGEPLNDCAVHEVMARPVVTSLASDSVETAHEVMRRYRIRRLPIVDGEGRLVSYR